MRRSGQALSPDQIQSILKNGSSGVLALSGDGGYPYAVPISYVFADRKLFFHCAVSGHKTDAIRRNPKASFCVVARDQVVPEEYTTRFQSVIVFGKIRILEDEREKIFRHHNACAEIRAGRYGRKPEPGNCKIPADALYAGNDNRTCNRQRIKSAGGAKKRAKRK